MLEYMNQFTKKYQLWESCGNSLYDLTEYDTLDEAILAHKNTMDWYITEAIEYETIRISNYEKPKPKPTE